MNGVFFLSADLGWAFGQSGFPGVGKIVKTTNGGLIWTDQAIGTVSYFNKGLFTDSMTGWAVGNKVILKTSDGGDSWIQQNLGYTTDPDAVPFHSVYFHSQLTGWAVGGISWLSVISMTTDGGNNWINTTFEPPAPQYDIGRLSAVKFFDEQTGWIAGRVYPSERELILKTTNGGLDWVRQDDGVANQIFSLAFADAETGWAVGENGTVLHTTNGGVTFVEADDHIATEIELYQNYPNPFNPSTTINFAIPEPGFIELDILDIQGRVVASRTKRFESAGVDEFVFIGAGLSSGIYFYRLTFQNDQHQISTRTRKLLLIR